jgi:hypothetical protein
VSTDRPRIFDLRPAPRVDEPVLRGRVGHSANRAALPAMRLPGAHVSYEHSFLEAEAEIAKAIQRAVAISDGDSRPAWREGRAP